MTGGSPSGTSEAATDRHERWPMLTSYDALTAAVFEQAGVRALLVGDTSAEMVLGYPTTLPVTMDEMVSMVAAVVRGYAPGIGGGRSAVRQLPRRPGSGPGQRGAAPEGRRCPGGQAGRRGDAAAGQHAGRCGHPGHGPPRADPAERQHPRRDAPGPGPRSRRGPGLLADALALERGRGLRRRAGVGPSRAWGGGSPSTCGYLPSASARARPATPRSWSGRTWPG